MTTSPTLRLLRMRLQLSQAKLAERLEVSVETLRLWDSGRRPTPDDIIERVQVLLQGPADVLLPLRHLAATFNVHVRTLRAAARDGRLEVTFSNHAFFGRPVALATGRAVATFLAGGFGKSATALRVTPPLASVPRECFARIIGIRARLGLSQAELARRVGAANRAVVYQWEAGKRLPSAVFWTRLLKLRKRASVTEPARPSKGRCTEALV